VQRIWRFSARGGSAAVFLLAVGCAPVVSAPPAAAPAPAAGLPPVPTVEGPLAVRVVHPPQNMVRPNVDSVFVYGSVGSGRAMLTINGAPVEVAPNGAFLGFVRRPPDDTLRLVATADGRMAEGFVAYRPPTPAGPATPVQTIDYPAPREARVTGGDTLATGSDVAIGRPTPTGAYQWFLPQGARLTLTGERADMVRARLDAGTEAWFPRTSVTLLPAPAPRTGSMGAPTISPATGWTDVRIPAGGAPFMVQATDTVLVVTVHGVTASPQRIESGDGAIALVEVTQRSGDVATVRIHPRGALWGFRAFYEADGTLALRVRQPPQIHPVDPLRGIRIAVDPGHPPGGATGPTALTEAEANLAISLRLAEQLRARGAEVLMTRTTGGEVSLAARVNLAAAWDADILISVHNNAFPEGVNPFRRNGTSTYYFHPFSAGLAQSLQDEILATTRIRDLGAISGNLALVRPTWMPSVLTESLFMPIPEQESALRDDRFLDQLAAAHVRGIERFLLSRAGRSTNRLTDSR
jgi:N-acetylmuramoyl-L-alanine amidase